MKGYDGKRSKGSVLPVVLPFALLFVVLLIWHLRMKNDIGDDSWFRAILSGQGNPLEALGQYLGQRYNNWTSRLASEAIVVTVTHAPMLWRVLDSLILTGIPALMLVLLNARGGVVTAWAACALMLLYPLRIFGTAGWITTTIFYAWPFFFGLIAMIPFARALRGRSVRPVMAIPCLPALLIACNNEQLCLMLLGMGVVICGVIVSEKRKLPALLAIEVAVMLAALVFVFTCPGNWNRSMLETETWFPEFKALSFLVKFELGYSSTGYLLLLEGVWLFVLFCALIAANVWRRSRRPWDRAIALVPVVACLVLEVIPALVRQPIPFVVALKGRLTSTGTGFSISAPSTWLPDLLLLAVFACVVYGMATAYREPSGRILAISLLLVGLATRVMIGFSPTIWASMGRTAAFLYFALMALSIQLTDMLCEGRGVRMALTCAWIAVFCARTAVYLKLFR